VVLGGASVPALRSGDPLQLRLVDLPEAGDECSAHLATAP
jgi:hypothetical protein